MICNGDKGRDINHTYTIRGNALQKKQRNSTRIIQSTKRKWSPNQKKSLQGTNSTRRFNKRVSHLNNLIFSLIWSCLLKIVVMQTLMKWFEIEWLLGVILPKQEKSLFRKVHALLQKKQLTLLELARCLKHNWKPWQLRILVLTV